MFPITVGQVVITLAFQDNGKMCVLQMYKGFCSNKMANCLVSNIILPTYVEKVDGMTCSKLNQLVGFYEYKVSGCVLCFIYIF